MWQVSSCSGVATLRTAIHLLLMSIPEQRVTSLRRLSQSNDPAASYWLRRALDDG